MTAAQQHALLPQPCSQPAASTVTMTLHSTLTARGSTGGWAALSHHAPGGHIDQRRARAAAHRGARRPVHLRRPRGWAAEHRVRVGLGALAAWRPEALTGARTRPLCSSSSASAAHARSASAKAATLSCSKLPASSLNIACTPCMRCSTPRQERRRRTAKCVRFVGCTSPSGNGSGTNSFVMFLQAVGRHSRQNTTSHRRHKMPKCGAPGQSSVHEGGRASVYAMPRWVKEQGLGAEARSITQLKIIPQSTRMLP